MILLGKVNAKLINQQITRKAKMNIANKCFRSIEDMEKNLDLQNLNAKNSLVQIFSGFNSEFEVKQIQSIFREKNPKISFIGTTTAGEINGSVIYEKNIVISIVQFEHTTVKYGYFTNGEDYDLGKDIAHSLILDDTKLLILFANGLCINGSDVVDGISSVNTHIPIAGGVAGDNGAFIQTLVFNNDTIGLKSCVGVSLNSKRLEVFTDYQLNWQPIGQTMFVTKANKNRLYELDGIPVVEVYKKYLGHNVSNNLPFSATEFPLLKIDDGDVEICRTFTNKFEDGSLLTIGNLEVGDKVRLAFGNIDLVLRDTRKKITQYKTFQPEAIFTYSCTVRKSFLQSEITAELDPLAKTAPTCGFFTYGEFFSKNSKNSLLNITLTILGLKENNQEYNEEQNYLNNELDESEKNFITNKHFLVLDALTTLSNTVIDELSEANKELEKTKTELEILATTDKLTGIYNRAKLDDLFNAEIDRCKRYKNSFGCAIFDLDHFKEVNDTHGHLVGDEVLKNISNVIKSNMRKSDIFGRWGGEEFVLILPEINEEGMIFYLEKLRVIVSNYTNEKVGTRTVSIGATLYQKNDTVDSITKRADDALYKAKRLGRNNLVLQ